MNDGTGFRYACRHRQQSFQLWQWHNRMLIVIETEARNRIGENKSIAIYRSISRSENHFLLLPSLSCHLSVSYPLTNTHTHTHLPNSILHKQCYVWIEYLAHTHAYAYTMWEEMCVNDWSINIIFVANKQLFIFQSILRLIFSIVLCIYHSTMIYMNVCVFDDMSIDSARNVDVRFFNDTSILYIIGIIINGKMITITCFICVKPRCVWRKMCFSFVQFEWEKEFSTTNHFRRALPAFRIAWIMMRFSG